MACQARGLSPALAYMVAILGQLVASAGANVEYEVSTDAKLNPSVDIVLDLGTSRCNKLSKDGYHVCRRWTESSGSVGHLGKGDVHC